MRGPPISQLDKPKPTAKGRPFVIVRTAIGYGSQEQAKAKAHREPLGWSLGPAFLVLREARRVCEKVGLATMSDCARARWVFDSRGLLDVFDFVGTLDDVEHRNPDPASYPLVAQGLRVEPDESQVIEDSANGTKAALVAPFTRKSAHASGLLDRRWIVDDPATLSAVAPGGSSRRETPDERGTGRFQTAGGRARR